MTTTLGQALVNSILPKEYRNKGSLTKKQLHGILAEIAKKHPEQYPDIVTNLKRLGDEVATLEGISVGLDDIEPNYKERDKILKPHIERFNQAKTDKEKQEILIDAQKKIIDLTKNNAGTMAEMARSGGRGNFVQLARTVSTPVLATDEKENIVPWFIRHSYAEGLKPAEGWVAGNEARINAIKSNISVIEPGDIAKILINNTTDQLITMPDCGTHNGISMKTTDPNIVDRYLARDCGSVKRGTLVTPQITQQLHRQADTCIVRSPMTCEAHDGICQKCHGVDNWGKLPGIGINVGVRSAQSMSEPLTQFALSAKHGGQLSTKRDNDISGITGLRQVLEVPDSFLNKAILASHDGKVSKVETAPQGGHYIYVGDTQHYLGTNVLPIVKAGQIVEAGDALSDGVPKPDEVVGHKGIGAGRKYLVDVLNRLYEGAGQSIDKRHFELLAKTNLNHVYVVDVPKDQDHKFMKGDVLAYNQYKKMLAEDAQTVPLQDAIGETLADNVLHYTAGTRITESVKDELEKQNIKKVNVAVHPPIVEFMMRPATRNPLLNPDWLAKLSHRYLKDSILTGAHTGGKSNLHGYHPVPGYAQGHEFGQGDPDAGTY